MRIVLSYPKASHILQVTILNLLPQRTDSLDSFKIGYKRHLPIFLTFIVIFLLYMTLLPQEVLIML